LKKPKNHGVRVKRIRLAVIVRKRLMDPQAFWALVARVVR
jgi:hypothetical protein